MRPNFTAKEMLGLEQVIKMEKQGLIVIVPTDKTSGFACFDREDYIESMIGLLNETSVLADGTKQKHYERISRDQAVILHQNISIALQAGRRDNHITDHEFDSMLPSKPEFGRFYGLAKDHKPFEKIPEF